MRLVAKITGEDYGKIGEEVIIGGEKYFVGDVYRIRHSTWGGEETMSECMVVNKGSEDDNGVSFFMGIGLLEDDDEIIEKVSSFSDLKVGDTHKGLVVME